MNNLLALMHDTANDIGMIQTYLTLMKEKLEKEGIVDDKLDEWIAKAKTRAKNVYKTLDKYYEETKT